MSDTEDQACSHPDGTVHPHQRDFTGVARNAEEKAVEADKAAGAVVEEAEKLLGA